MRKKLIEYRWLFLNANITIIENRGNSSDNLQKSEESHSVMHDNQLYFNQNNYYQDMTCSQKEKHLVFKIHRIITEIWSTFWKP